MEAHVGQSLDSGYPNAIFCCNGPVRDPQPEGQDRATIFREVLTFCFLWSCHSYNANACLTFCTVAGDTPVILLVFLMDCPAFKFLITALYSTAICSLVLTPEPLGFPGPPPSLSHFCLPDWSLDLMETSSVSDAKMRQEIRMFRTGEGVPSSWKMLMFSFWKKMLMPASLHSLTT